MARLDILAAFGLIPCVTLEGSRMLFWPPFSLFDWYIAKLLISNDNGPAGPFGHYSST